MFAAQLPAMTELFLQFRGIQVESSFAHTVNRINVEMFWRHRDNHADMLH
jgi:hypothetical protein